jgi:hypothetical protein
MPGGLHSFDVALFKGKLYASINTDGTTPDKTLMSTNMGQTWTTFISQYSSFVVFDDFMFVVGNTNYTYNATTLQIVTPNLFVASSYLSTARKARFQDGVLYSCPSRWTLTTSPLYFLPAKQITNGGLATAIVKFADENVRDVVVRGNTCYVMTATEIQEDASYRGRIYSSSNLTDWPLATEFTVPGIPLSFEIMTNKFYVGLGSRYDGTNWDVLIGPEAGSIWQVTPRPGFTTVVPSIIGGVTLGIKATPNFNLTLQASPDLVLSNWTTLATTNQDSSCYTYEDLAASNATKRFYRVFH